MGDRSGDSFWCTPPSLLCPLGWPPPSLLTCMTCASLILYVHCAQSSIHNFVHTLYLLYEPYMARTQCTTVMFCFKLCIVAHSHVQGLRIKMSIRGDIWRICSHLHFLEPGLEQFCYTVLCVTLEVVLCTLTSVYYCRYHTRKYWGANA